jgi:hypothetical protein
MIILAVGGDERGEASNTTACKIGNTYSRCASTAISSNNKHLTMLRQYLHTAKWIGDNREVLIVDGEGGCASTSSVSECFTLDSNGVEGRNRSDVAYVLQHPVVEVPRPQLESFFPSSEQRRWRWQVPRSTVEEAVSAPTSHCCCSTAPTASGFESSYSTSGSASVELHVAPHPHASSFEIRRLRRKVSAASSHPQRQVPCINHGRTCGSHGRIPYA